MTITKMFLPMKKILFIFSLAILFSCGSNKHPMFDKSTAVKSEEENVQGEKQINDALKDALSKGVRKEVTKIGNYNSYFKNDKIKFGLPENMEKVEMTFRNAGMGQLCDIGIELLNHTAEDATSESKKLVLETIQKMTFKNATEVLKGSDDEATKQFKEMYRDELIKNIAPIVIKSYEKVGAQKHWTKIMGEYNNLKFVKEKVTPDFTEYISKKTVDAILYAIANGEKEIRNNEDERDIPSLRTVFALQD